MSIKRRYRLRKTSIKRLIEKATERFGRVVEEPLKKKVEIVELDSGEEIISVDDEPFLFKSHGEILPALKALDRIELKRVVVDMGAVPHIVNGADVMAPGIAYADEKIAVHEVVVIVDEKYEKPIAIGKALVRGTMMKGPKGKVVENLHHVGDKIWKIWGGSSDSEKLSRRAFWGGYL
jgi:PUA domain protein